MSVWTLIESTMYHSLRLCSWTRVRAIDEGGLPALLSDAPLVVAANHQSHADAAALFHALPPRCRKRVRFVASAVRFSGRRPGDSMREQCEREFVRGLAVGAYRSILVGGDVNGLRAVELLGDALDEGAVVAMFPEGTRSRTGALGPLKPGVAMLAISKGCPVVPVRIDGGGRVLPKATRVPRFGKPIELRFRTPISALSGESHADFLERLSKLLAPHEGSAR